MAQIDIFNLDENIDELITDANEEDLYKIVEKFKNGDFQNLLPTTQNFRDTYEITDQLANTLALIEAISHAQIGQANQAAMIVKNIYENVSIPSIDDLILFGNVAFMCDFKLCRRIMSDVVKRIENEKTFDKMKTAQAFNVLGEAEERLDKFIRATRYYRRSLTYFKEDGEEKNKEIILYLHYKLGTLLASLNEIDEAIEHLHETIERTDEATKSVKMNSLVSIAKLYSNKDELDTAITYLKEAIPMIEQSSLAHESIHAEAYMEIAYNYFQLAHYDEAASYYETATTTYKKLPDYSHQELGVIYMQYAYCVIHKQDSDKVLAGTLYEKAYEQLRQSDNPVLLENALTDIIVFFDSANNKKKKKFFEEKLDELMNEDASMEME